MAHPSLSIKIAWGTVASSVERIFPAYIKPKFQSLKQQYGRILSNVTLYFLWTLPVYLLAVLVVSHIAKLPWAHYGLMRLVAIPLWTKYFLSIFILDFMNYLIHRSEHAVPLLWRFHSVHHSDLHMDMSTAIRKHPVSGIFTTTVFVATLLAFGIPAECLLFYNVFADIVGFLAHSSLSYSPAFSQALNTLGFISPANHRMHHSDYQPETDSNFGQMFCFWDKIFGTFTHRENTDGFRFGLEYIHEHKLLPALLVQPFNIPMRDSKVREETAVVANETKIEVRARPSDQSPEQQL